MVRGETILDYLYGPPPGANALIEIWTSDLVDNLLEIVWKSYDLFQRKFSTHIAWEKDYDDLERSITQKFELTIQDSMNSFLPYKIQHGPFEEESRSAPPAQPPQYDMAFVLTADTRIMWPLEAKVLKSDKASDAGIKNYIATIKERYLTCKYAPFSNGGAMLGYLKSGDSETVLNNIEAGLKCPLTKYSKFSTRNHKTSVHTRTVPSGKNYPADFQCHHMILLMGKK